MKGFQPVALHRWARSGQSGVSLFELLIVLTIMSLAAGIAGLSLNRALPALSLRQAASVLEADLQRARTLSLTQAESVEVSFSDDGYVIAALGLSRSLPEGTDLVWSADVPLAFTAGAPSQGGAMAVERGKRAVTVRIEPFTGRVSRDAPL